MLATGGAGQLFGTTTNPRGSKGTGYALALEAGCELVDMEFVSFEPFITTTPGDTKRHDLPTTVLKQGARLRNGLGEEFLDTANAPTKDVICRAMMTEVAEGRGTENGSVYYDIREMEPEVVNHYVQIGQAMRSNGAAADPGLLQVMPAQHYLMGGARIDADAATSVPGLFAVGEVAGGAHGGHRLAGAGGMEVVAGGAIAGESAAGYALVHPTRTPAVHEERPELLGTYRSPAKTEQLRIIADALHTECGIFRNGSGLAAAAESIRGVLEETRGDAGQAFVTRGAQVALSIAESARRREESRGDHFRTDYRLRDDSAWLGNQVVRLADDGGLDLQLRSRVRGIRSEECEMSEEQRDGLLSGVRVIDLTRALSGPFCAMLLGDQGADVVKIERPGRGDDSRTQSNPYLGTENTAFLSVNRNKKSVVIDLRKPEGARLVQRLAAGADVLIENFRPGKAEELGLGWEQLREANPRLVYCSISGWGADGPSAHKPGYATTAEAWAA